jgi:cytidylate kinase
MTVITISREWGSEGAAIAAQVASRLGYQLVAKHSFEKILQQYGLVQLDTLYKTSPGFWARLDDANLQLISMLNKIMLGIAHRGDAIILGRGGFSALDGYADVLHVRIQAPFALRVKRIREREQVTDFETAKKLVAENDKARHTFIQAFYDIDVDTASQFNLVLDTRVVSIGMAVDWIAEAVQSMSYLPFTDGVTTKEIEVDAILADAIEKVMAPVTS